MAIGVILNERVVAFLFSPDGHIESTNLRIIIGLLNLSALLVGTIIIRNPKYAAAALTTLVSITLLGVMLVSFHAILDYFPETINYVGLSQVHYYGLRASYVVDDELVLRRRPRTIFETHEYRGDEYKPIYGADVSPMYFRSVTDADGFRNITPRDRSDIVVLGDSFIEFGHDEYDTFGKRLEVISGHKVKNLGVGWYGPFQYLAVFKRYGLKQQPLYALFCFFEGNDLGDIREYLRWKEGGDYWHFNLARKHFFQRLALALGDLADLAWQLGTTRLIERGCTGDCLDKKANDVPPDLVILQIGSSVHKTVFLYKNELTSPDLIMQTTEYSALREILRSFQAVASLNRGMSRPLLNLRTE
jgi:hypothetical protein